MAPDDTSRPPRFNTFQHGREPIARHVVDHNIDRFIAHNSAQVGATINNPVRAQRFQLFHL